MNQRIIPKYDDYELIGRVRTDAVLALANSDPLLLTRGLIDGAKVVHKFGAADAVGGIREDEKEGLGGITGRVQFDFFAIAREYDRAM